MDLEIINNIHIQNITSILKQDGGFIEGNLICDIYPDNYTINDNLDKIINLRRLCKDKKKIIEIGINACHSLVLMLLENPTAEYLLFDLGNHTYTKKTFDYVKSEFPTTTIRMVVGNSVDTIPMEVIETTYDLCHLDGGHTEDVFSRDYENIKRLISRNNGIIIFDDFDLPAIREFILCKLTAGEIIEVSRNDKQFIYKYA